MARLILFVVLAIIVARAFWRFVDGITQGLRGGRRGSVPQRGVAMARDPVCGTFVVPDHTLSLPARDGRVFFCSAACRDRYQRQSRVRGRTA